MNTVNNSGSPLSEDSRAYATVGQLYVELCSMTPRARLHFKKPAAWERGMILIPSSKDRSSINFVGADEKDDRWNCLRIVLAESPDCTVEEALTWLKPRLDVHRMAGVCVTWTDSLTGAHMLDPAGMFEPEIPPSVRHRVTKTLFFDTDFVDAQDHPLDAPDAVLALNQDDPATIAALLVAKKWDWSGTLFVVRGRPGPLDAVAMRKEYPGLGKTGARGWETRMCDPYMEGSNLRVMKGTHQTLLRKFGPPTDAVQEYLDGICQS